MRRGFIVRIFIVFIMVAGLSYATTSCLSFRISDKKAYKYFAGKPIKPSISKVDVNGRLVNYADIGSDSLPVVVFLHGAPGGWNAFIDFMANPRLLEVSRMISIDRPGYGYSGYGEPVSSLKTQGELMKPILKTVSDRTTVIVGHSLGAPIAVRMAVDYPELVDGLILVGPSIDPELEKDEWYRYLMKTALGRLLLPGSFWSTNEEIFVLKEELEELLPLWQQIHIPVIVIQGTEDSLVPRENADFAQKMIKPEFVEIWLEEGVNHFIPWNRPDLIEKAILQQIARLE